MLCTGAGTFAPDANANGAGRTAPAFSNMAASVLSAQRRETGPCFGIDGAGNPYATAGPGGAVDCTGGITVGIGPYDPTQTCTFAAQPALQAHWWSPGRRHRLPVPLHRWPAGPCLVPNGLNSTYLPNGTLNQWDAPMPPAEISFGITRVQVTCLGQQDRPVLAQLGERYNCDGTVATVLRYAPSTRIRSTRGHSGQPADPAGLSTTVATSGIPSASTRRHGCRIHHGSGDDPRSVDPGECGTAERHHRRSVHGQCDHAWWYQHHRRARARTWPVRPSPCVSPMPQASSRV